jgi:hypothetical protein
MNTTPKITPSDYPDLLAQADAGMTQREQAGRYDCAPSLIARHLARAKRARELSQPARAHDADVTAEQSSGSMRELLEARIRDPKTSPRDLAALVNSLARLEGQDGTSADAVPPVLAAARMFRCGTLVLEPVLGPELRYRLIFRVRGGFEHIDDSLTPQNAFGLITCALVGNSPEAFGLDRAELEVMAKRALAEAAFAGEPSQS